MRTVLYASIWIALIFFVAGEAGKDRVRRGRPARWAWPVWALGAAILMIHMLVAFLGWYAGSHDAMVRATARQTAAIYGVWWGGGVYVNYVFAAVWIGEAVWWRRAPDRYLRRPALFSAVLRAFDFVVIVNAAVIFASPAGRVLGVPLVAALGWLWRPPSESLAKNAA